MKKNKLVKSLLLSLFGLIAFTSIGVGTTYALFTNKSETRITASAGSISSKNRITFLKGKSKNEEFVSISGNSYTFENGGTADLDIDNDLKLENITPGDAIELKIDLLNNSKIKTKYRFNVHTTGNIGEVLKITYPQASKKWKKAAIPSVIDQEVDSTNVTIEFPSESSLKEISGSIVLTYDLVQGNANTSDAVTVETSTDGSTQATTSKKYASGEYYSLNLSLGDEIFKRVEVTGPAWYDNSTILFEYEKGNLPSSIADQAEGYETSTYIFELGYRTGETGGTLMYGQEVNLTFKIGKGLIQEDIKFYLDDYLVPFGVDNVGYPSEPELLVGATLEYDSESGLLSYTMLNESELIYHE